MADSSSSNTPSYQASSERDGQALSQAIDSSALADRSEIASLELKSPESSLKRRNSEGNKRILSGFLVKETEHDSDANDISNEISDNEREKHTLEAKVGEASYEIVLLQSIQENKTDDSVVDDLLQQKQAQPKLQLSASETAAAEISIEGLKEEESDLRRRISKGCSKNILSAFLVNGYSAVLVFVFYLMSLESLFSIALSIALTVCKCLACLPSPMF